jgi:hypothetical protein
MGLKQFYDLKKPENAQEKLLLFVYYGKKYLGMDKMEPGHILFCFKYIVTPVPNIPQMMFDIAHKRALLVVGEGRKYAQINTAGENFIDFNLPRKKDVKKNKATT